jgi:flagellar motor switch/type III secretory pathway protein FliN
MLLMLDIPLDVAAAVTARPLRVSEILGLRAGSVITTLQRVGGNLDVYAGKARVGAGEFSEDGGRVVVRMARLGSKG